MLVDVSILQFGTASDDIQVVTFPFVSRAVICQMAIQPRASFQTLHSTRPANKQALVFANILRAQAMVGQCARDVASRCTPAEERKDGDERTGLRVEFMRGRDCKGCREGVLKPGHRRPQALLLLRHVLLAFCALLFATAR